MKHINAMTSRSQVVTCLLLVLHCTSLSHACGRGGFDRPRPARKMTPLVFKEHVPKVPEFMLGASGTPEGRIRRGDSRFKNLVMNQNPDVEFKDEEGNQEDRLMTQVCKKRVFVFVCLSK